MNANGTHQVFDSPTRTRYINQRESRHLQNTIKDLSCKQHLAIYRHTIDQNNWKIKLHEFIYESRQRDLYKLLNQHKSFRPIESISSRTNI